MKEIYGLDGAMIGRASIGNPWFFDQVKYFLKNNKHKSLPNLNQRVETARRHLQMAILWKGEVLGLLETRRHYANYFRGIEGFKPYRISMVTANTPQAVYDTFDKVLSEQIFA